MSTQTAQSTSPEKPKPNKGSVFGVPLRAIRTNPLLFWTWAIVAIVLGSSGFWYPILLGLANDGSPTCAYYSAMSSRVLMGFSVVLLADGLGTLITAVRAGRSLKAAGLRGVVGAISMLILIICVGMSSPGLSPKPSVVTQFWQILLTGVAVATACYLYCFRYPDWEEDADHFREEDEKASDKVTKDAAAVTQDDEGTRV